MPRRWTTSPRCWRATRSRRRRSARSPASKPTIRVRRAAAALLLAGLLSASTGAIAGPAEDLLAAAAAGDHPKATLLLGSGAPVDAVDGEGRTALHLAANIAVAKALLDHGASPNAQSPVAGTPLHVAAATGNAEVLAYLASRGGEVAAVATGSGRTPLDEVFASKGVAKASPNANYDLCAAILVVRGVGISRLQEDGRTYLHMAAAEGYPRAADSLIAKGIRVNARTKAQRTPLHYAAGNFEMARLLVNRGADVNATDVDGKTPLALALEGHHASVADFLRQRGAQ